MLGKAVPEAQASGKVALILLLSSAAIASFGSAPFWPHAVGSVPLIWLPASVSSLQITVQTKHINNSLLFHSHLSGTLTQITL